MEPMVEASMQTYSVRLETLRATKLAQTAEKQGLIGSMDHDDHGLILPPVDRRKIVQTMSSSGMPITDCLLEGFSIQPNHPSGGFFGPKAVGENFRRLLEVHPVYLDPVSSLAGGYMVNFMSYRKPHWNPDISLDAFREEIDLYKLLPGIGASQHFCQDLQLGMEEGWGGLLRKIRHYRKVNTPRSEDFYTGLEAIVLGVQDWISRHARAARQLALAERDVQFSENLVQIAEMNEWLVNEPPRSFREACQWILWYQITARMFNGSGSLGRLDVLLQPYFERDTAEGILSDEEAIFHIACLLLRDTAYLQLGGPDAQGNDLTSRVSYLVLEAGHRLRIPANVGVCVGENTDPGLVHRAVEIQFSDRAGYPKFLGIDRTVEGFTHLGYPPELGRQRAYSGCHWSALPGREYTLNDCVKINFARVFEVAIEEMLADSSIQPSTVLLLKRFEQHLERAVQATARCLDFQIENMHKVYPEMVLDLCCHGPIESGMDASHGGVEFYNLCVDGSALATVADSFASLEQRVDVEGRIPWQELHTHLRDNWSGVDGERVRRMMKSIPHYGTGGSRADDYAGLIARNFAEMVANSRTPQGYRMVPGLFSWANTIPMGKEVGATPNGRFAGDPISHGANPDPGFRKDGAPTAMAAAIAAVQPGYGNTAPMQIELDPMIAKDEGGVELVESLIRTHFLLGGTQINLNVMDSQRVLEAHKDPSKFPDLVVRVTGFSAYFASLSPQFRQLVVDRIISNS